MNTQSKLRQFKRLLTNTNIKIIMWRILVTGDEFSVGYGIWGSDSLSEDEIYFRIIYSLKRKYCYRFIWSCCYGSAYKLRRDIISGSKYWSGGANINVLMYKCMSYNYMLAGISEDIIYETYYRIKAHTIMYCCDDCLKLIHVEPIVHIIRRGTLFCNYCERRKLGNALQIDCIIGLELFGQKQLGF